MLFNNEYTWVGASLKHITKPNISFTQAGNLPLDMFFRSAEDMNFYFPTSFLPPMRSC
jgi:hypothetical protein